MGGSSIDIEIRDDRSNEHIVDDIVERIIPQVLRKVRNTQRDLIVPLSQKRSRWQRALGWMGISRQPQYLRAWHVFAYGKGEYMTNYYLAENGELYAQFFSERHFVTRDDLLRMSNVQLNLIKLALTTASEQ